MADAAQLLGRWRILSWRKEDVETGALADVIGPDPVGEINYGADGRVFAFIVARDRPRPATAPIPDEDKARLLDTMIAYAGTYTLGDGQVVHHIDRSSSELWTGTDQLRFWRLEGDRLTITGAPGPDPYTGRRIVQHIAFVRWS